MKERPILFQGAMVRALLDGSKTQTRRVMKTQLAYGDVCGLFPSWYLPNKARTGGILYPNGKESILATCPYGQPGDRLWVREAHAFTDTHEPEYNGSADFRADGKCYAVSGNQLVDVPSLLDPFKGPWRPSIHMPRWASRILLEIVSVRVERLNDISEADCWSEGIEACDGLLDDMKIIEAAKSMGRCVEDAAPTYAALWESINGAGSWAANQWVWVVEFKRVKP